MLPAFNSYDDDLIVCYLNAVQLSALRDCLESKNIKYWFHLLGSSSGMLLHTHYL